MRDGNGRLETRIGDERLIIEDKNGWLEIGDRDGRWTKLIMK